MPAAVATGVLRSHPRLLIDAPRFATLHVVAHAWCHDLDAAEIGAASVLPDAVDGRADPTKSDGHGRARGALAFDRVVV